MVEYEKKFNHLSKYAPESVLTETFRCKQFDDGLNVKPEKNSIFLKKGKTVISVENRKFSRSQMTKRTTPLNSSRKI